MADRPHIILIITDQQRYDTIAALGFPFMDTPNLDRLVREGTAFTNSFVTAASCAPARASLFTGYYPHTTGVLKNADVWRHSWVEDLAAAGYYCVNIGKMHTFPYETPLGFHERFVVENKDRYLEGRWFLDRWDMAFQARGLVKQQRELYRQLSDYAERLGAFIWELPEELHADMFVGNLAEWWLRTKPQPPGPLFMEIGFPGPHPPYDPPERYAAPYLARELPLPDYDAQERELQPDALRELIRHHASTDHDSACWSEHPTREQLHRQRAHYLANVTLIDERIGGILAALEERGYLQDAVVIFTSDHGDCLGDHGIIQKWSMYDIVTRTPLIVWAPGRFAPGQTVDDLVQQFDIAPVILQLAGLAPPSGWAAQSLWPYLQGERPEQPRDYVYAEQVRDGILTGAEQLTMIRSREWKLVHHLGNDDGELYDLVRDRGEHRNLWGDPAHAARRQELLAALLDWWVRSDLGAREWGAAWR
jgi:arylsulfatase A-like enzyme